MNARFEEWLDRRIPVRPRVQLHQGNLYIFPTRQGLLFMVFVALLLIGAINYQNSLLYLLAFLLGSLMVATILATFRNLSGLQIERLDIEPAQVGKTATCRVRLVAETKPAFGVILGWDGNDRQCVDVSREHERALSSVDVALGVTAIKRGRLKPGRMLLESFYPLGLVRCWSYVNLGFETWVYPVPLYSPLPPGRPVENPTGDLVVRREGSEFYGLRPYRAGDAIRSIAWRRYASNANAMANLVVREFAEPQINEGTWFDLDAVLAQGLETRLRHLVGWVMQAHDKELQYGLRLGTARIEPAAGVEHRQHCLKAIALFGATEGTAS